MTGHTHTCKCGKAFTPRLAIIWCFPEGGYSDADCPDCGKSVEVWLEGEPFASAVQRVAS